ncbi:O-antigen ligase family protein [Bradyrhizobium sp. CNPSo 4010]|uniref:O-antigen ligase family protein n=1 Tax=Bradyrhizobium agreste TaxID=2751811 RepID=A0ABS0PM28_9BRAD|nr:O-antigen ligase family protein [Bradyrhizobium agreste]MBH5398263.1 O-antigen ligase family protein [Bradyrhizobium agreste]
MVDASNTFGVELTTRQQIHHRARAIPNGRSGPVPIRRARLLVAVVALAGILLPSEVQITLAPGARFTAGRVAAVLLLIPALFALLQRDRRILLCDFLAVAAAAWMILASLASVGTNALSSAGGDALDFIGGYLIARAYIFGRPALDVFIRVLKIFATIAIVLAVVDSISGRLIVHETVAAMVHAAEWPAAGYRNGMVRAASTFDHAIAFGVFCALTAPVFLYWEKDLLGRTLAAALCSLGCVLSGSSAALMAFAVVLAAFSYDRLMMRYSWRWSILWAIVAALGSAFFVVAQNPLGWIISHLTLDPQTGYFRMLIWEVGWSYVVLSPITGYAYETFNNNIIDGSVDAIWLLYSLRFGIPMLVLFFLTNMAALLPSKRRPGNNADDIYMDRMRHAFTLVILMFMFTGLTVHFWNYMLTFWGLCIGIRASLRELSVEMASRRVCQEAKT